MADKPNWTTGFVRQANATYHQAEINRYHPQHVSKIVVYGDRKEAVELRGRILDYLNSAPSKKVEELEAELSLLRKAYRHRTLFGVCDTCGASLGDGEFHHAHCPAYDVEQRAFNPNKEE